MDDLIQRQAVLDALRARFGVDFDYGKWWNSSHVLAAIESVPSVTPQEPKAGSWRHYEGMLTCSACGAEFYDDIMEYCGDDVPKCCPECGARMVDPEEGGEKE